MLGSVFLVVTGAEALYAGIGYFGKSAIRLPWFAIVLPALLLNYWGQGALVCQEPAAISNPFFLLSPTWALYPLVLFTLATVIAAKIAGGGWVPLAAGVGIFTLMTTWRRGRQILAERLSKTAVSSHDFLARIRIERPVRVFGVAVYMSSAPDNAPLALMQNYATNKVPHERILLLAVSSEAVPRVLHAHRRGVVSLGESCYQGILRYGFTQSPDVPRDLRGLSLTPGERFGAE